MSCVFGESFSHFETFLIDGNNLERNSIEKSQKKLFSMFNDTTKQDCHYNSPEYP